MNHKPWQQATPLTASDMQRILQNNFPELPVGAVLMLGEGWDNTTWLVNGAFVFRMPKHREAAALITNEMRILPHLPDLGINTPRPVYMCLKPQGFPYPFYGHLLILGKTGDKSRLTEPERLQLAKPIAQFLKKLHAFPIEKAEELGVGYDRLGRVAIRERFAKVKERLSYLASHGVIESSQPFLACYQRYIDLEVPKQWVLAHGDLYVRHLIFDDHKQFTGVIDWGDCELIHPAVDLAIVYQLLPSEAHAMFWREYGDVSGEAKIIAKLRAIYSALTLAWYAHQVKDAALLDEGIRSLKLLENA